MCEAAPIMAQFRVKLPNCETVSDNTKIEPRKAILITNGYEGSLSGSGETEYSKVDQNAFPIINNLTQDIPTYIDMLNPPEILESIKMKLHISDDVEEKLVGERYTKYALNNIFNMIGQLIGNPGFNYRIDANIKDDGNAQGWERMEITVKFPDDHYEEIDAYWKRISTSVSDFYKSLQGNPEFSEDLINRLRRSIYIIMFSEE